MIYDNFVMKEIIYNEENSIVTLGEDNTCIKRVDLPKCFRRLDNEAKCLILLDGYIAPKLIEYSSESHELRMEYINGLTLPQYVDKYGKIPRYFFAKVAKNLLELLDKGIEYGGDRKINEHFLIIEEKQDIRIIDFGVSNIIQGDNERKERWKTSYKSDFAFVFEDADKEAIEYSKSEIRRKLSSYGINNEIIDEYFNDYDKI